MLNANEINNLVFLLRNAERLAVHDQFYKDCANAIEQLTRERDELRAWKESRPTELEAERMAVQNWMETDHDHIARRACFVMGAWWGVNRKSEPAEEYYGDDGDSFSPEETPVGMWRGE